MGVETNQSVEEKARDMLSEGGDNTVRLYAYDDQSKFLFNVKLEQAERFTKPFIEAVNHELGRRITAALAPLAQELERYKEIVDNLREHLSQYEEQLEQAKDDIRQALHKLTETLGRESKLGAGPDSVW